MSHFILSCTTCATRIPGKDEIQECFALAPAMGYKAWAAQSTLFWWPGMTRWANLALIRASSEKVGLSRCTEVFGAAIPTDSLDYARCAAGYRAQLFEAAHQLGSPLVVITGRPRREEGLERTIAGIKALLPLVEHLPVWLALEPHFGSQIQEVDDYAAIFDQIESSKVGITLDSGHFHAGGVDWRRLIRRFPERIYNFHVKDHIGLQSVPLGAGEVDLRGYIEELHGIHYEGALAVELEVADPENLPLYCADAFIYLRELVAEVTGRLPD